MADGIKGKVEEAGHTIAEKAKEVAHKVSEGVEKATDWVKEKAHQVGHRADEAAQKAGHTAQECGVAKGTSDIREHMDVIGSCGNKLGVVDHLEGGQIKLTRKDSADGQHHFIPVGWVARVDEHIHLSKGCGDAKKEWTTEPAGKA
jgi:hypothetical protein